MLAILAYVLKTNLFLDFFLEKRQNEIQYQTFKKSELAVIFYAQLNSYNLIQSIKTKARKVSP